MDGNTPSTTVENGRDGQGRFAPGNSAARGNPHARTVAKLRAAFLSAVSEQDVKAIVEKLVELAKGGNLQAIRLLLDRVLGRPDVGSPIDSKLDELFDQFDRSDLGPVTPENIEEHKRRLSAKIQQRLGA